MISPVRANPKATAWAVFLGCRNALRLAIEMRIDPVAAQRRLDRAEGEGLIVRTSMLDYQAAEGACATT